MFRSRSCSLSSPTAQAKTCSKFFLSLCILAYLADKLRFSCLWSFQMSPNIFDWQIFSFHILMCKISAFHFLKCHIDKDENNFRRWDPIFESLNFKLNHSHPVPVYHICCLVWFLGHRTHLPIYLVFNHRWKSQIHSNLHIDYENVTFDY